MKNYYKILGVGQTATKNEIKSAFKNLGVKYHPDFNPGVNPNKFKEVKQAYEILSDDDKRKRFDNWLSANGFVIDTAQKHTWSKEDVVADAKDNDFEVMNDELEEGEEVVLAETEEKCQHDKKMEFVESNPVEKSKPYWMEGVDEPEYKAELDHYKGNDADIYNRHYGDPMHSKAVWGVLNALFVPIIISMIIGFCAYPKNSEERRTFFKAYWITAAICWGIGFFIGLCLI